MRRADQEAAEGVRCRIKRDCEIQLSSQNGTPALLADGRVDSPPTAMRSDEAARLLLADGHG
uniref:Uncharacterized protein n=1 Tax=Marseillevirus LCMAC202 TaxID=2506606 RepID=A0A481YYT1_9VIRU|nr:MAG: hypothetical protein LCMAC202_00400 [Marseillevirus LCMAC202]